MPILQLTFLILEDRPFSEITKGSIKYDQNWTTSRSVQPF